MFQPFKGTDLYKPEDIPDIDFLIITHEHWDHLDYYTVKQLKDRIGTIICGLGVGNILNIGDSLRNTSWKWIGMIVIALITTAKYTACPPVISQTDY